MNKLLKKLMIDTQTSTVEGEDQALSPQEGMIEEILIDDPIELALTRDETEHNVMSVDADGYDKMLDSAISMEKMVAYLKDITPDEDAAYDFGPLDDDADDVTYWRWMVDSQRKNKSLMKRILKAITGDCFGSQEGRTSAQEQTPQQSHRPGKGTGWIFRSWSATTAEQEDSWSLRQRGVGLICSTILSHCGN
ncbi:hypothetical protein F2Q70_00043298 [Brassica cretica]|uniref:Uncharacterized protein n=1 Tax=Brassica cretica TaxID=69181 RepID=A0A8S9KDB1_BRACR|nr:hypothetical protein F2Q70_00043298 [Brassica cretica]